MLTISSPKRTVYISHPELIRGRLDRLRFDIEWMGLPASLADHYKNYPQITGGDSFKTSVALINRNLDLGLSDEAALFEDDAEKKTKPRRSLLIDDVGAALGKSSPGFAYTRRTELDVGSDLRTDSRHLRWELAPLDFGHSIYPSLAASKARELSVALAKGQIANAAAAAAYQVNAPYTPTIKQLSVGYRTSISSTFERRTASIGCCMSTPSARHRSALTTLYAVAALRPGR